MNNIDLNNHENSSMSSFDIGQTLDKLSEKDKNSFITLCCDKLAYGSKIKITGIDLDSFCKDYLYSSTYNINAIFGISSTTKLCDLENTLKQHGLTIDKKKIQNGMYTIEAIK